MPAATPTASPPQGPSVRLFSPLRLRDVTLPNRIVVSPMCQYCASDGMADDWHLVHLGRFAIGGAGMVMVEATAVEERGRISYGDLGLWRDEQITPLRRIVDFLRAHGSVPAIQLAHAGRKASMQRAWRGNGPLGEADAARGETGWPIIAPSALAVGEGWITPAEMSPADIDRVAAAFVEATRRADAAGFDAIEVHAAHGYLLHSFLSPLTNRRTDAYGGTFENRTRLPLRIVREVRAAWPQHRPLFVRLSAIDDLEGGWTIEDSVRLARRLKDEGVDIVDCSSGGVAGSATAPGAISLPRTPGFQVPFARQVRAEAGVATMAVGLILTAEQAEAVLAQESADLVAVARTVLDDPNWPMHARSALVPQDAFADVPPQVGWWLSRWARLISSFNHR